ncbi:RNA-binding protein 34 [Willisornis vidua]|uniref:RNA-binding protein 34 n=1 Tax=Willisornis vidua TaxID=1566151 RepID=A0ABQ9DQS9_9PASS|nr:RNA-binding protein 34 [Willisornis vidua]
MSNHSFCEEILPDVQPGAAYDSVHLVLTQDVSTENKKRKRAEEVEKASEDRSAPVVQEPVVKAKKARKKEPSKAEKKLADRENSLNQADEEENQKLFQNKTKQKKKASQAIARSVVNSATGTTAKQQNRKKVADEAVDRRTVFVGNLPVTCTVQVLKSLFKKYGQIQSIRFRSLIPAEDTISKKVAAIKHKMHPNAKFINAYVVFKEECDAQKALKDMTINDLYSWEISHMNTDAVHLALKLNNSVLMGRKIRVQRIGQKKKAPQRIPDQSRAPKGRVDTTMKKKSYSNDSFVGEKATPLKKSTKPKRLKTIPKNKAGKNKQTFDKNQTDKNAN